MDISLFNTVLDVVMIIAIAGLWVMWMKQATQRKKVETMLMQASEELEQATALLDKVMTQLPALQEREEQQQLQSQSMHHASAAVQDKVSIGRQRKPHPTQSQPQEHKATAPAAKVATRQAVPQQHVPSRTAKPRRKPNPDQGSNTQSAQIMRLNREGMSQEAIAEQLDMPIAQVRLMLLLQAPKV